MSPGSSPIATARTARRRIFAERVFGSASTSTTREGLNGRPSSWATSSASSPASVRAAAGRHHEAPHRLALGLVRHADHRRLGHGRVRHQHRLHLGRAEPLAGHVDRVVGAPEQEPLAVLVDLRPVAVAPDAGEHRPVGLDVALGVAPDAARHARPRLLADELADLAAHRAGPPGRTRRRPSRATAPPSEQVLIGSTGYGERKHAPTSVPPEMLMIGTSPRRPATSLQPRVRLGVPRLAGRAEDPQRREVVLRRPARRRAA